MKQVLLSRNQFREGVFERDNHKCVFCNEPAQDAHHILERRLWGDGGYYLDNGASVCGYHHIECEKTTISVEDVRHACGITKIIVPEHLYPDQPYDKWGNPVMTNGQRVKGELFFDESVQKILKEGGVLGLFTNYVKYPRTYHLPWSPGMNDDDRMMKDLSAFEGQRVVVTEKMDGENTTGYRDYIHARSVDGRSHSSQDWVKQFWSQRMYELPEGWRLCGENLYAKHSIPYDQLPSFFMGFSIWDERMTCLSWDETLEWFELLDIVPVPVLYDGLYDPDVIKDLWNDEDHATSEGYVLRVADEFAYSDFRKCVGKFVRQDHVQTRQHWKYGQVVVPNQMIGN